MSNLREAQKGTILGEINDLFEKGDFSKGPKRKKEKDEKEIGELTDYEKATWLALNKKTNEFNAINDKEELKDSDKEKILRIQREHRVLEEIFWSSVKLRIGEEAEKPGSIGVRDDWKVVACESSEPFNCFLEEILSLSEGMSFSSNGIIIIERK